MDTNESNVIIGAAVADKLDNLIDAPMDAMVAIGQVSMDLPALHQKLHSSRLQWFRQSGLRVYRAKLEWCGVGIDYIQYGEHLHVIDAWENDPRHGKIDCVFEYPEDSDKYIVQSSPGDEVRAA